MSWILYGGCIVDLGVGAEEVCLGGLAVDEDVVEVVAASVGAGVGVGAGVVPVTLTSKVLLS